MAPGNFGDELVSLLHPAAIVFAICLPFIRGIIRHFRKMTPCFKMELAFHDVASGFAMPSFLVLAFSSMYPSMMAHADGHAASLAGALGILYTVGGILKGGHS